MRKLCLLAITGQRQQEGVIYDSLGLRDTLLVLGLIPDIPTSAQRLQAATGAQGTPCCHTRRGDEQRVGSAFSSQPFSPMLVLLCLLLPHFVIPGFVLFLFFFISFHLKIGAG